jgi:predicted ATP-grasp superfamily ATP-dependent carboligase
MHRREREFPVTGGASIAAESVYDEKLKDVGKKLLDALSWHGVAMVEFKLDEADNQFKLMEINPKFWGSLDLAIAAGVDFPYDLARMSRGEAIEYSEEYKRGLRYQWPIEDLICVKSHPSYFWPFFKDLCNFKVKKNITIRDLNPTFHYLCTLLGRMIMGQKRKLAGGGPYN